MIAHAINVQTLPPRVRAGVDRSRVLIVASPVTDYRQVTRWLASRQLPCEELVLGMGSDASRQEFRRLQQSTGWHTLPQIFLDGHFLGGIEEFFRHVVANASEKTPADDRNTVRRARILGYAGLIPFIACSAAVWLAADSYRSVALQALLAYAAVILSFVGALHWMTGLQTRSASLSLQRMGFAVIPALMGWVALLVRPASGLALLIGGFALVCWFDQKNLTDRRWFLQLRRHLTTGAELSLMVALVWTVINS